MRVIVILYQHDFYIKVRNRLEPYTNYDLICSRNILKYVLGKNNVCKKNKIQAINDMENLGLISIVNRIKIKVEPKDNWNLN